MTDDNRLEEIIAQAQRSIEIALRRVYDKHGDVSIHFERGIREVGYGEDGYRKVEHTDRSSITVDAPDKRRTIIGNVCGHPGGERPVDPGWLLDQLAPGEARTVSPADDTCPSCQGSGVFEVRHNDEPPFTDACWDCGGSGRTGASEATRGPPAS